MVLTILLICLCSTSWASKNDNNNCVEINPIAFTQNELQRLGKEFTKEGNKRYKKWEKNSSLGKTYNNKYYVKRAKKDLESEDNNEKSISFNKQLENIRKKFANPKKETTKPRSSKLNQKTKSSFADIIKKTVEHNNKNNDRNNK